MTVARGAGGNLPLRGRYRWVMFTFTSQIHRRWSLPSRIDKHQ